jgi:hypothetical protein
LSSKKIFQNLNPNNYITANLKIIQKAEKSRIAIRKEVASRWLRPETLNYKPNLPAPMVKELKAKTKEKVY